jgi:hypothetical protein
MSNPPNPVPPPGKPRIGIAWLAVVGVLALVFAAWIYGAAKPTHGSDQRATSPTTSAP